MAFSEEQNKYIYSLHSVTHANAPKAVDLFIEKYKESISEMTVRKKWRSQGFELGPRGGGRPRFDEDAFRKLYEGCNKKLLIMHVRSRKPIKYLEKMCHELGLELDV